MTTVSKRVYFSDDLIARRLCWGSVTRSDGTPSAIADLVLYDLCVDLLNALADAPVALQPDLHDHSCCAQRSGEFARRAWFSAEVYRLLPGSA